MRAVIPNVTQFALMIPYSPLIQTQICKLLLRTQPLFRFAPPKRVGRAAKVCVFAFEMIRLHRVLSVQIAINNKEPSF